MARKHLKPGTWILVADGQRAIVLRIADEGPPPLLRVVKSYGQDNPPTRDQASDKAGRRYGSSIPMPDYHQQAETEFVIEVMRDLEKDFEAREFSTLVIAAAPGALGAIRKEMSPQLRNCTIAEIAKGFTNTPQDQMPDAIMKALDANRAAEEAA